MLRHQLGQHLVLGLDLLFQVLDALLIRLTVGPRPGLESRGSVFKQLLLPPVENRRLESHFVAELGNRLLFQQMPPQDGDLLFSCMVLPCPFHAFSPLS